VLLVWALLRKLAVPGAFLAAALFAIHPVHVESVAWVAERKNVLSGLFYLLAGLAYLRFSGLGPRPAGGSRPWGFYFLSLVLLMAALLSKTVTCSLPAAILLVLWWKRERLSWSDVWPLLPMAALGAGLALLTAWVEKNVTCAGQTMVVLPWAERIVVAGRSLWFYLGKLAWPAGLSLIYPRWPVGGQDVRLFLYPAAAAAGLAGLWLSRRRIGKGPLTAVLFYAGTSLPTLGVTSLAFHDFSFVADHFQYLADIGPMALAAAIAKRLIDIYRAKKSISRPGKQARRLEVGWAYGLLTAGLVIVLGTLTWRQARLYRDEVTIWTHTVALNPATARGYYNLAYALAQQGAADRAIAAYEKSVSLDDGYVRAHVNLASLLGKQGREQEAIEHLRRAIELEPTLGEAHFNLGLACLKQKAWPEAIKAFRQAVQYGPHLVTARKHLAYALLQASRPAEAVKPLTEYAQLQPADLETYDLLAVAYAATGRVAEAAGMLHRGLQLAESTGNAKMAARFRAQLAILEAGQSGGATNQQGGQ